MRLGLKHFVSILSVTGTIAYVNTVNAAGFQIWEQDASSFANFHAGYAALANNASIAWYNPAGITRIKNQQFVFNSALVITDFKYKGDINIPNITSDGVYVKTTAQGGTINVIPAMHYVAPINDWIGFGFSVTVPFGLKTDYGKDSLIRYASTVSGVKVIDISPSLGFKITDKLSFGIGSDIQKMYGEFNSIAGFDAPEANNKDTSSINKVNDTAYGYHLGLLYEFNSATRAGISYHSQVRHHLTGTSRFSGPLAKEEFHVNTVISRATVDMTLPAYLVASVYHQVNPKLAYMGSVTHTQWNTFKALTLKGVSGFDEHAIPTKNLTVTIPQNFRNTINVSVGADYAITDEILLRGGIGYDQAPVKNHSRTIQLPDNNRYVFALGAHYQATKTIGIDAGWTHLFIGNAKIKPPTQEMGAQKINTNGAVSGGADAYSIQIVWDML